MRELESVEGEGERNQLFKAFIMSLVIDYLMNPDNFRILYPFYIKEEGKRRHFK